MDSTSEKGDRTLDLRVMIPAFYQLNYFTENPMVAPRVALGAPGFSDQCSTYWAIRP